MTPYPDLLCRPLDVKNEQPVAWQKELLPGYQIGLRPVSLHTNDDINAIHEWLTTHPAHDRLSIEQLRILYLLMAECSYAQAFMVLLNNDIPVGRLEVYQLLQDELNDVIEGAEGDYRLYIPVMPVITSLPEITLHILQSCVHYFFSFSEVKRLYWAVPANDVDRNQFAGKLGFQLLQSFYEFSLTGTHEMNIWCLSQAGI